MKERKPYDKEAMRKILKVVKKEKPKVIAFPVKEEKPIEEKPKEDDGNPFWDF